MIHMQEMLQQASKIIYQTADTGYTTRNNTKNAKNGEIFIHEEGMPATLLNNQALNLPIFERAVQEWEMHARTTGSANDAQLGITPPSGTPFALQNLVVSTGQGIHEYRRGKLSTFWTEIYRDWILPDFVEEMNKGDKWVEDLSLDDMQKIVEDVMNKSFTDYIKKVVLYNDSKINGELVSTDVIAPLKEQFRKDFMRSSKKFLNLIKNELKEIPIDVEINIAGKQKDLNKMSEKLTNIFRQVIANPQVLAIPGIAKIFNEILETSGLSPMDFSEVTRTQVQQAPGQTPPGVIQSPIQQNQLPVS